MLWPRSLLMAFVLAVSLAACASRNSERLPASAASALTPLRTQLVIIEVRVARLSIAARDVVEQPDADLAGRLDNLDVQLDRLQSQLSPDGFREQPSAAEAMRLFTEWDQRLLKLVDEAARPSRQAEAASAAGLDRLRVLTADAHSELAAFIADLRAAETYLQANTTLTGVREIAPKIEHALAHESSLLAKLREAIEQIDVIQGRT